MFDNREPHGMEFSVTYQHPLKDQKEKYSSTAIMAKSEKWAEQINGEPEIFFESKATRKKGLRQLSIKAGPNIHFEKHENIQDKAKNMLLKKVKCRHILTNSFLKIFYWKLKKLSKFFQFLIIFFLKWYIIVCP